ncbi:MAG TPA: carboxyltransferase domain-containing protein, partial [Saprospiraceae bacterium]|nr:carboxyltransferase domain-containing protein [Saprospiraceae bacterium]
KQLLDELKTKLVDQHQYSIFLGLDSIMVHHSIETSEQELDRYFRSLLNAQIDEVSHQVCTSIPVFYDLDSKDWPFIEKWSEKSRQELIALHLDSIHLIEMYGFLPGFAYLKNTSHEFNIPRKSNPDRNIKASSVALAGNFTGIYPVESPGGWHIIGKTPKRFFQPHEKDPAKLKVGTYVKFHSISLAEYFELNEYA